MHYQHILHCFFPLICHLLESWQIAAKRWKTKQCSSITYIEKQQKKEKSGDKQILNRNIEASADCVCMECIFVWASSSSWHTRRHYKGSLTSPWKWLAAPLSSLKDPYTTCCLKRARSISRGCTHPGHRLFKLPPSVRGLGALKSGANQGRLLQQAKCLNSANTWVLLFKSLYIWFTSFILYVICDYCLCFRTNVGEYFCTKDDNKELTFSPDVQVKLKAVESCDVRVGRFDILHSVLQEKWTDLMLKRNLSVKQSLTYSIQRF